MKFRKPLALITAVFVIASSVMTVLAADWDLEQQGSLHIDTNTDYHVTSTDGNGNSVTTSNTITVADNVTTNITLDNVSIAAENSSGIDIGSGADVTLNLEGSNSISNASDQNHAAIHVADGSLTITSENNGTLYAHNGVIDEYSYNNGAGIGSNAGEDMSGSITIGGNATVMGGSDHDGAGIGSGKNSSMSGSITIKDNTKVEATGGEDGAAIGSGDNDFVYYESVYDEASDTYTYYDEYGNIILEEKTFMSGSITITDNAQVIAESGDQGAGIGSGSDNDMTGSITINGNSTVWANSEDEGAGIGTGEDSNLLGSITIGGNANVISFSDYDSAGIGGGEDGDIYESGSITITDNSTVVAVGHDTGSGIGAGGDTDDGESMKGTITISGNAKVIAIGGSNGAAIGTSDSTEMTGTIRILDNAQVATGISADDDTTFSRTHEHSADEDAPYEFIAPIISYHVDPNRIGIIGTSAIDGDHTTGLYYIDANTTINGIPGWDIETLSKFITFAKDRSNLNVIYNNAAAHLIWNDAKDISALVSGNNAPTMITEEKLKDEALVKDIAADKILRSCHLSFDKDYTKSFILRFHLSKELAGKTVEILHAHDGKIESKTVTVSASGMAAITTNTLGDFAVIAK